MKHSLPSTVLQNQNCFWSVVRVGGVRAFAADVDCLLHAALAAPSSLRAMISLALLLDRPPDCRRRSRGGVLTRR